MADETKKVDESADISILFNENTPADVKERVKSIFEAAVDTKATQIAEELSEAVDQLVEERLQEALEAYGEAFDKYVSYVAEEWIAENELAIESSTKVEIAESLMGGLIDLISAHNLEVPEDADDVLEGLIARNEELKEELNGKHEEVMLLRAKDDLARVTAIVEETSKGLPETKAIRLKELAENIKFKSVEDFKSKVESIKTSLSESTSNPVVTDPVDGGPLNETKKDAPPARDDLTEHVIAGTKRYF